MKVVELHERCELCSYTIKIHCDEQSCDTCPIRFGCFTGVVEFEVRGIIGKKYEDQSRVLEIMVFGDCEERFTRASYSGILYTQTRNT